MPRKKQASVAKEQATISKFFTSTGKEKSAVATDKANTFETIGTKSSRKHPCSSASSNEEVPNSKKLRLNQDKPLKTKITDDLEASLQNTNGSRLDKPQSAASSKLIDFEFKEGSSDHIHKSKWKFPRLDCEPDNVESMDQDKMDSDNDLEESESCFLNGVKSSPSVTRKEPFKRCGKLNDPTRVVAGKAGAKLTPLEQQFVDIKAENPGVVLFVECGYKYRFFGEDAEIAAKVLNIYCHMDHNFMTASVPVHRLFVHVRRLVAAGYKVGIVKQTETPHLKAAGSNKSAPFSRRLTALYTKSTLIGEDVDPSTDSEAADGGTGWQSNHYLMCVCQLQGETTTSPRIGLVCVDASTGEVVYDEFTDSRVYTELDTHIALLQPVEILLPEEAPQDLVKVITGIADLSETKDDKIRVEVINSDVLLPSRAVAVLTQFYGHDQSTLQEVLNLPKLVTSCLAALSIYLKSFNLERSLSMASDFRKFSSSSGHMYLNSKTLHSLEVFKNSYDGTETGSLYWVLNHTCTKFGARLLRKWLAQPLLDVREIQARHEAVQELVDGKWDGLKRLEQTMVKLPDVERGLCSIFHKKCSFAQFCAVAKALEKVRKELNDSHLVMTSPLLHTLLTRIPDYLSDISDYSSQINEKAARENDKSNLFVDDRKFPTICSRKEEIHKVEDLIQSHLREVRLLLRQPSLKYVTVQQAEYLVEVKTKQLKDVPSDWTLINSTKTVSRFHSPFLKEQYKKLNELREQLQIDVTSAWHQFLETFSCHFTRYQRAVTAVATLDCLMSFSKTASQGSFCRPKIEEGAAHLDIEQGRHPIIDALSRGQEQFVPNDTHLNAGGQRVMVISGPNMGGKSSYIRQVALISIMAQAGSFVPAEAASLGVVDGIYTRMGATDEIFKGSSTFMVELQEAAEIMTKATDRSLVVLDELGRGTSTYDGVAIAHATLEYFIEKFKCLVMFVTHFPLMSEFHSMYPEQVQNFHMAYLLSEDDKDELSDVERVTFLYQLSQGATDQSYGLNVARLAQIPDCVLKVAARKSNQLAKPVKERMRNHQFFSNLYRARKEEVELILEKYKQSVQA